ncbi:MAG TPA: hypothetical protein VL486_11765 [Verrucomicrobiae bacterium]|nr:hypothetical protein [Verrucomicrobiae bacterium]
MDSQQAKRVLWLYRPGVDDADPQFAEALAQVEHDPDLQRWLDEHCAEYTALRAKLKDIRVPADLPDQILGERPVDAPIPWWRSRLALGTAAAVVVVLLLHSVLFHHGQRGHVPNPRATFAAFRDDMVYYADAGYKLDIKSFSLDELRQVFASNGWPSDYTVPPGLTELAVRGGCLTKWNEHKVSMLCLTAANDHKVWLFVVARSALSDAPAQSTPKIATQDIFCTASWSESNKTYLLVAEGDEPFVRSLL